MQSREISFPPSPPELELGEILPTKEQPRGPYSPVHAKGFPELAFLISTDQDFSIFRRFDELSARNLLRMQSELIQIDEELHMLDRFEFNLQPNVLDIAKREALMSRLEILMPRYHKSLIMLHEIHTIASPNQDMADRFDHWLQNAAAKKAVGDFKVDDWVPEPPVPETPSHYWRTRDYILLKSPTFPDSWVERFTQKYLGRWFKEKRPVPPQWDGYYFSRSKVERVKDWLAVPLAVVFLVAPALLFHFICDGSMRLAILLAFIIGLSLLVQIFMGTTRNQTLASALAYTGVLGLLLGSGTASKCR